MTKANPAKELSRAFSQLSEQLGSLGEIQAVLDGLVDHVDELDRAMRELDASRRWPAVMNAATACEYLGMSLSRFNELVRVGLIRENPQLTVDVGHRMFDREELDSYRRKVPSLDRAA